jgi:IS5 family transposase
MITKQNTTDQLGLFHGLAEQLDQKHPLYLLANKINWSLFEERFAPLYSEKMGAPAKPIRLMVSLLMLKYLRNLSDENLVEQWSENNYYQYFGGEQFFRPSQPCVSTELVAFRHRIGEWGMELILQESIKINKPPKDENMGDVISVDTTVQEKNIAYPTDDKLYKKIIKSCIKIAEEEGLKLRQTYAKEIKELSFEQRFKKRKNGAQIARKASKRIKTIAGRLVRDISCKLSDDRLLSYSSDIALYRKVLSQKRGDSNKIYSLHEPDVKCYAKGKEHKKFEFGSKVSIAVCQNTGIILGALNFTETLHDSKTIPKVLDQYERLNGRQANEVYVDRGYRGVSSYKESRIYIPKPNINITQQQRNSHSKRAAIEPVIGHLKQQYRLCRNYLKGVAGDNMNVILAAAAMNFKRAINLWKKEAKISWLFICNFIATVFRCFIAPNLKLTF